MRLFSIVIAFDEMKRSTMRNVRYLTGLDGYMGVQKIGKDKEAHNIPVIALTARVMKGDRENIIDTECDADISKPIDP